MQELVDQLLSTVKTLDLSAEDLAEIERLLKQPGPLAEDFAKVKAIIRNRTLERVPTTITQDQAEAYVQTLEELKKA